MKTIKILLLGEKEVGTIKRKNINNKKIHNLGILQILQTFKKLKLHKKNKKSKHRNNRHIWKFNNNSKARRTYKISRRFFTNFFNNKFKIIYVFKKIEKKNKRDKII